jgi:hypothetical protein
VQIDPIRPTLKPTGTKRLKLQYDEMLSNFAINFNLRRYTTAPNVASATVADIEFTSPVPVTMLLATNAGNDGGYFGGTVRITRLPTHGILYRGLAAGGATVDPSSALRAAGETAVTCDEAAATSGACARSMDGATKVGTSSGKYR